MNDITGAGLNQNRQYAKIKERTTFFTVRENSCVYL